MKIMLATDGSRPAEAAVLHISRLIAAGAFAAGDLVVLTVSRGSTAPRSMRSRRGDLGHALVDPSSAITNLSRARAILARHGLDAKALWRVGTDPVQVIVETAQDQGVDMIVLGSRVRPIGAPDAPDSVSEGVLKHSPVPVMVMREHLAG